MRTASGPAIFQAFKVSTDGTQHRRGYVPGLTHAQARDGVRFPFGTLEDARGRYFWSYSIMPQHLPPERR